MRIDHRNHERAALTATTAIDRRAFGMTWDRLGAIGNDITIQLHVELRNRTVAAA